MRTSLRVTLAAAMFVLGTTEGRAEEIRVLSSVGIKAVIEVLGPQFERATKHKVTTVFDLAGVLKTRIEGGEPFDVAILTQPLLDELIAKDKVSSASRAEVARVGLGLMIRAGAPKPNVCHCRSVPADAARREVDLLRDDRRQRRRVPGNH